jgi:hypothetical protein
MAAIISSRLLSAVLNSKDLPTLMDGATTHDAARDFSAAMIRAGANDDQIKQIITAALPPDYAGDTLVELPGMIAGARKKGFSDEGKGGVTTTGRRNGTHAALDAISKQVQLFHDTEGKTYFSTRTAEGGLVNLAIDSKAAKRFVRATCYLGSRTSLSELALQEVMTTLDSRASVEGPCLKVFRRYARTKKAVYIDLGTPEAEVVQITGAGWKILTESPLAFIREPGMQPLPRPVRGGSVDELGDLLQVKGDNFVLLLAFLMNCLRGTGPFLCLLVEGQQGSGKSFLCETIKQLIDPNKADKLRLPRDEQTLILQAMRYYLPVYDNASGMKGDLSDALCSVATGGAIATRTLYTNDELSVVSAQRPFIINGIGDFVNRQDLLERAIVIQLPALRARLPEHELNQQLEVKKARILGALYDAVSLALREADSIPPRANIRMIDAARWIEAAEPALGLMRGDFARILEERQDDIAIERIGNEPIVAALESVVFSGPFYGSMRILHERICDREYPKPGIPQGPAQLSKLLKRLAPELPRIGLHVRFEPRSKTAKPISVWKDGQTPVPATTRLPLVGP